MQVVWNFELLFYIKSIFSASIIFYINLHFLNNYFINLKLLILQMQTHPRSHKIKKDYNTLT